MPWTPKYILSLVTAVRIRRALYLLAAVVIFAGGYYLYWRLRPVSPGPGLTPVATSGGGTIYQGKQVPGIANAKPKPKPHVVTRPVVTVPTANLPPKEQAKVPDVPAAAGPDNVVRPPEFAGSTVVPASRGDTHVRAYLLPDGTVAAYQDPQREPFWGWALKRVELEGRLGLAGNTQAKATVRWIPARMGNVQLGAEGSVATETNGVVRGEGALVIRWEPFRGEHR